MNNRMAEVAKLLGLELREEFRIKRYQAFFRFTEDGLQKLLSGSSATWTLAERPILRDLLKGKETVVKFPWKPAKMETYYVPCVSEVCRCDRFTWFDDSNDHFRLRHGLVFKTRDEAVAMTKHMLNLAKKILAVTQGITALEYCRNGLMERR